MKVSMRRVEMPSPLALRMRSKNCTISISSSFQIPSYRDGGRNGCFGFQPVLISFRRQRQLKDGREVRKLDNTFPIPFRQWHLYFPETYNIQTKNMRGFLWLGDFPNPCTVKNGHANQINSVLINISTLIF